ncbi:hypothetical protein Tco_1390028 [Tanacetum coccineum]
MMWACPKKIIESVPCLIKRFIKSLLKSCDFISKICCFGRREEFVDKFLNKIIPCENRSRGFFFKSNSGCTLEGKWEKHKLYRRTRDVRELHRRSDLVEISDVSMRVFFVMSEKLFVLYKGKQTVLKLKVVRGDLGNNDCILVTHGGCFEQLTLFNSSKRKTIVRGDLGNNDCSTRFSVTLRREKRTKEFV